MNNIAIHRFRILDAMASRRRVATKSPAQSPEKCTAGSRTLTLGTLHQRLISTFPVGRINSCQDFLTDFSGEKLDIYNLERYWTLVHPWRPLRNAVTDSGPDEEFRGYVPGPAGAAHDRSRLCLRAARGCEQPCSVLRKKD